MWETWVQFLGWEEPLEEGMATHASLPAWRIPMGRGAWWATANGVSKESDRHDLVTKHSTMFLTAQLVKNLPIMQETLFQFLG